MIKQRLFSFGMVLSVGFLLLVSLLLSAGLAYLGRFFGQLVPMPPLILQAINFVISFVAIAVLFGLMFKYVPAAKITWRDVSVGAVGTALLFTIGKQLLGLYLGKASVGSTYGAAGSLVAVVVWIYYSAQIFFFGAEFTHVYAESHGAKSESAAMQPAGQAASQPEGKAQPLGQTAEVPVSMAATVGSPSPVRVPVPPLSAHVSQGADTAFPGPTTVNADTAARSEAPRLGVPATLMALGPRKTKPRLLIAVAIGFVLGRVFGATNKSKPSRSQ